MRTSRVNAMESDPGGPFRTARQTPHLPSWALERLSERRADIPMLAWGFVQKKQREIGRHVSRISQRDMERLTAYDWPGNVRKLANIIERALILSDPETLELSEEFGRASTGGNARTERAPERARWLRLARRGEWQGPFATACAHCLRQMVPHVPTSMWT